MIASRTAGTSGNPVLPRLPVTRIAAERQRARGQRHRFRHAQAGAVEQQQDRQVSSPTQSLGAAAPASSASAIASAGLAGRGRVRGRFGARVRGSCAGLPWASAATRKARTADISRAADEAPSPFDRRSARNARRSEACRLSSAQSGRFLAAMAAQEFDQAMGGGDIGTHRVRAASPVMGKMASPARGKRPRRMPFP